jgi:hypothetical protein
MARLQVNVKANARRSEILSEQNGVLTVAVAAPPEGGKANRELLKFLAKKLKKQVRIRSGFENKTKIVEILDV